VYEIYSSRLGGDGSTDFKERCDYAVACMRTNLININITSDHCTHGIFLQTAVDFISIIQNLGKQSESEFQCGVDLHT